MRPKYQVRVYRTIGPLIGLCKEETTISVYHHFNLPIFGNRWCKRESVECNALKGWKISIFNIVDKRTCIKFYSHNTNLLPP